MVQIMDDEYRKSKMVYCSDKEDLNLKLLQTTQQFASSFDYDLPLAYSIKGKVIRFIKRVIRKSTRFITKPYAEQMLKFQKSLCELLGLYIEKIELIDNKVKYLEEIADEIEKIGRESELKQVDLSSKIDEVVQKGYNHEEAIYKLTSAFNDNANLTLELSASNAQIKQYLFGGEDSAFRTYSQAGEDRIISFILKNLGENKQGCSYLDIGCNHYKELNNTYHFYENGMRGVLVDANPRFIDDIRENRPEDTILNVGIGEKTSEKLRFYILNGDGLSSFNKETIDRALQESSWLKIEQEIEVPVITINEIFEKYFYTVPTIVSVDIEGDELSILKSINMERYRPLIYIIETIEYREKIDLSNKRIDIIEYMQSQDYKEYAFTGVNSIFLDAKQFS